MTAKTERSKTRVKGFKDAEMDFQLLRQLGACAYGGASLGESLAVAQLIQGGVPDSWVKAFTSLARKEKTDAPKSALKRAIKSAPVNSFSRRVIHAVPRNTTPTSGIRCTGKWE